MALTNDEKDWLRDRVKREIAMGRSMQAVVERFVHLGFKESTIKHYYKTFKEAK